MYCTAPLSPRKGCLRSFRDDDDDDNSMTVAYYYYYYRKKKTNEGLKYQKSFKMMSANVIVIVTSSTVLPVLVNYGHLYIESVNYIFCVSN